MDGRSSQLANVCNLQGTLFFPARVVINGNCPFFPLKKWFMKIVLCSYFTERILAECGRGIKTNLNFLVGEKIWCMLLGGQTARKQYDPITRAKQFSLSWNKRNHHTAISIKVGRKWTFLKLYFGETDCFSWRYLDCFLVCRHCASCIYDEKKLFHVTTPDQYVNNIDYEYY